VDIDALKPARLLDRKLLSSRRAVPYGSDALRPRTARPRRCPRNSRAYRSSPTQWQVLRYNIALVRPAYDEVLRWESPIQTFFRTTTRLAEVGGVAIPADAKILLFLASSNRDPRKWNEPERFDINRHAAGHVAFGAGIYLCVGQMLARLEAEMILTALAARVARIDLVGGSRRKLSSTLRQFGSLLVELIPA
jgi:4-methoxybenzoate monooxygenase (O-demethylating)